jgi:hypothetical protein
VESAAGRGEAGGGTDSGGGGISHEERTRAAGDVLSTLAKIRQQK